MSDGHDAPTEGTATGPRPDGVGPVRLPDHVRWEVADRIQDTEFDSVDEYVTFVMESLLRELDERDGGVDDPAEHGNDSENSDALRDRLESLGYV